jgi:K+ transporter
MSDESSFDLPAIAASMVIILGMLFAVVRLLPVLTAALYAVIPPVLILWFIVIVLRGIVKTFLG